MRCVEAAGRCTVEVEDTGIGIEKDQLEAIFTEFHQVKAPGSRKEGFGLGLAIVRRLAELLQLQVNVRSTPGSGSCFTVSLPTVQRSRARISDEDPSDVGSFGNVSGLVVIIEDDADVANAWGLLLEAEGYSVAMGASVSEAEALVRHLEDVPALIISDYHLQDGSTGVEAVKQIRQYYGTNIPCFAVSGDTTKMGIDARSMVNCIIMSKPVNTARLLSAARTATLTGLVPDD
jgi:CheY-like chemotaxis protein